MCTYHRLSTKKETHDLVAGECMKRFRKAHKIPDGLHVTEDVLVKDMAKFYLGLV